MKDYELQNIDPEEIEDLLVKVETSFDIKFAEDELVYITTFGQLCDHIANKIQLDKVDDCTSQQAFYKLRDAITTSLQMENKTISPDLSLASILPRENRRLRIEIIEKLVGFKLQILRPPYWVTVTLIILLLTSFVGLFFNWQIGLLGLAVSIAGLWFANQIGNELDLRTVGQVAQKMTRENYLKSRRNPKTFNKNEIDKVLIDWFSNDLDLDKSKLTRESNLYENRMKHSL